MSDLIEFLRARLDEDERVALAVSTGPNVPEKWTASQYREGVRPWRIDGQCSLVVEAICGPDAAHIERHDPKRVVAEVEAKRQILIAFEAAESKTVGDAVGADAQDGLRAGLVTAVQQLASIYADHPDYRPEWAPEESGGT